MAPHEALFGTFVFPLFTLNNSSALIKMGHVSRSQQKICLYMSQDVIVIVHKGPPAETTRQMNRTRHYVRPKNPGLCRGVISRILATLPLWWVKCWRLSQQSRSWAVWGWWEKPWGAGWSRGQCVRFHPTASSQTLPLMLGQSRSDIWQRADLMLDRHPVCKRQVQLWLYEASSYGVQGLQGSFRKSYEVSKSLIALFCQS